MSLEDDVLQRIRPSDEETAKVDRAAQSLKTAVKDYMDANGIDAALVFVGSYAKGTFLDGNDLDLFLVFPRNTPKEGSTPGSRWARTSSTDTTNTPNTPIPRESGRG